MSLKGPESLRRILSCADSRIVPEYAFAGHDDLFVCRVAGNFLNDDVIACPATRSMRQSVVTRQP